MASLKQSTAYTRTFLMVLTADHITGATGKTVTVNISKAGAAFGAAGGSVAEIGNGWYSVGLNTTDTATLGDLAYHCTASACDDTDFGDQVTALVLGDLSTPTNITAGTITTVTNLTNAPTSGDLTATMKTSVTTAATAATPTAAAVTGAVGSVTGLTASDVGAIKAKTDNLPAAPASTTNITAGVITTVTNLTNAPTAGDLTATMKTSVTTAATAATPTAAGVTGGATAASIAALNNISTAQVRTQVDNSLTSFGAIP